MPLAKISFPYNQTIEQDWKLFSHLGWRFKLQLYNVINFLKNWENARTLLNSNNLSNTSFNAEHLSRFKSRLFKCERCEVKLLELLHLCIFFLLLFFSIFKRDIFVFSGCSCSTFFSNLRNLTRFRVILRFSEIFKILR